MSDLFYTEDFYSFIASLESVASENLNSILSNFDSFSYDEQIMFIDVMHDLEQCVINCQLYKLAFEKHFKRESRLDTYRVNQDDTLVTIANKFYGDPTKWVDIYLANKLKDMDLTNVETLIIPELSEVDD